MCQILGMTDENEIKETTVNPENAIFFALNIVKNCP